MGRDTDLTIVNGAYREGVEPLCVNGWMLNQFEFVRLLRYSKSPNTTTLRFSKPEYAQRARRVLVCDPADPAAR